MRIFLCELKRIFTLKICLLLIAVMAVFGAVFYFGTQDYIELELKVEFTGDYITYINEIHDRYGDTFDKDEQEEWFAEKQTEFRTSIDEIIADEPILQKHSDYVSQMFLNPGEDKLSYAEFYGLDQDTLTEEQRKDQKELNKKIYEEYTYYFWRNENFLRVKHHFTEVDTLADNYMSSYEKENGKKPETITERLEKLKTEFPYNTTHSNISYFTSSYFTYLGLLVIILLMLILVPWVVSDKARKMRQLQYSSKIGKKLYNVQFLTAILTSIFLTLICVIIFFAPYASIVDFGKYHNSHLGYLDPYFFMFNITLTQYVLFLILLILLIAISFACIIFFLGRYSTNVINCSLKAIPTTVIFLIFIYNCIFMSLFSGNKLFEFLEYRLNIEIISAVLSVLAGVAIGLSNLYSERKSEF